MKKYPYQTNSSTRGKLSILRKRKKKYNKIIQITKYYVRKYPKITFLTNALILNNYIYLFQNGVKYCIT